jgi:peptidoglycan/xylan/chitin deacetylase (PgdA/CDA1 family)
MSRQIILAFHGLGPPPPHVDADEIPYWVTHATFENIVSRTAGRPEVVFTFDDGNLTDLDVAAPVLRRHGRRGEFFLLTGRIGVAGYLSVTDVQALQTMGMGIGLHGKDHVDWRSLNADQLHEETVLAREVLAKICGKQIETVSIPFGAYNRRVVSHLQSCGYTKIMTTDGGAAYDHKQLRNRTSIRSDMDAVAIEAVLSGRSSPFSQLRRTVSTFARRNLIS